MQLFIKQQVLSLKDRFDVKDADGNDRYYVEGEWLSFAKKLRVYDQYNQEILYIEQKLWNFLPEFDLRVDGQTVATVKKELTFFSNNYAILGKDWQIEGSITAHDYVIKHQGRVIADINKKWLSWGDSYEINIYDEEDLTVLLGIVIVIDCVVSASRSNNS
ncbi:hypothetical protein ADIAL_0595 [Alkalibacterium sp. AK22]|uniref:LURP-one-related/scramblase family protein n=1 Tax=Alkalibacterium sp. AK22 TaxID=1229520 RepID=UPI000450D3D8|nr:LURP-one-related family protein [Alkalibacterium sp. AK22]EXJ23803.1 hypothetical protein ADIAL_0595 [Alkalibacterium sp. AK22]